MTPFCVVIPMIILQRFFDRQIDRWQCINELHAAFTALLPRLTADNVDDARALTYSNEEAIEHEIRRRDGLSTSISNVVTTRLSISTKQSVYYVVNPKLKENSEVAEKRLRRQDSARPAQARMVVTGVTLRLNAIAPLIASAALYLPRRDGPNCRPQSSLQ